MLNINDSTVKRFKENLHNSVERRKRRNLSSSSSYDDYILENRLIKIFCEDKMLEPRRCAEIFNDRYGDNLRGDRVIQILRYLHLSYQTKRAELFDWAADTVDAFAKALETRSQKKFDEFIALRDKKILNRDGDPFKIQVRVVCIMLYVKHPELDNHNDTDTVEKFGNAHMKYFFFDMVDFLRNICIRRGNKKDSVQERMEMLENMLNRSDMMLKDLQDEFDEKIRESHQNEMIEFFSLLNSEKYGCILDAVLGVRNGVRKLRKDNVSLPPEIGGLLILIERLAHFIKDSNINPILKPGSVQDMRFDEIEACDYEGSPFKNKGEIKHVKVLSPGWFYQNKEIQIARPRLKEVTDD